MEVSGCVIAGCNNRHISRGWCGKHYQRWHKYGDPLKVMPNSGNRKPRPIRLHKTCTVCGVIGPTGQFPRNRSVCQTCRTSQAKAWKDANPDKVAACRARNAAKNAERERLRRAHRKGIDPVLVDEYRMGHDGLCEICHQEPGVRGLNIDHDHASGAFRGLLCTTCNTGLGCFRDSPDLLAAAAAYLVRPPIVALAG